MNAATIEEFDSKILDNNRLQNLKRSMRNQLSSTLQRIVNEPNNTVLFNQISHDLAANGFSTYFFKHDANEKKFILSDELQAFEQHVLDSFIGEVDAAMANGLQFGAVSGLTPGAWAAIKPQLVLNDELIKTFQNRVQNS
jgi:hypothetical protein